MRTTPRILALAAALALSAPSLPAAAEAPPTKAQQHEAGTRFKKGLDLYKDENYQAALVEFRRAYELAPNYNVLFNIGQVYFQLQDYPNALTSLERYLSEGGDHLTASRRAEVQKDIDKLTSRVANVEIVCAVPDADVTIDDVSMGRTPITRPIMVSAGRHKVTVSKAGFTASTKVIEIASGDSLKVPLEPAAQSAAAPVVVPVEISKPLEPARAPVADNTPAPPPPEKPTRVAPIVFGVTTGALTVGAVVTGILALKASSDLADVRQSASATRSSLDSAHNKTAAFALTTDVLAGAAVVALGVTLFTALKKDAPAAAAPSTGGLVEVRVGVGNGVRVLGSF